MKARSTPGERAGRALALLVALLTTAGPASAVDEASSQRWSGIERVVAIADVHGAYAELVGLLKSVGLVDEQLRWSAGATHLA